MLAEELVGVRNRRLDTFSVELLTTGSKKLLNGCGVDLDAITIPISRLQSYLEIREQLARITRTIARYHFVNDRPENIYSFAHIQEPLAQHPLDLEGHRKV